MKDRRTVLKGFVSGLVGLEASAVLRAQGTDPRKMRPQEGDTFVYAFGRREGETVRASGLELESEQITCYAKDVESGVVRDGSRLNQVIMCRFSPDDLSEETRAVAADGVVAYSAICPHTGCDISEWADESANALCSCHESEFDLRDGAVVIGGPAPRRLPHLPLRSEDGVLVAAAGFSAKVRFQKEL